MGFKAPVQLNEGFFTSFKDQTENHTQQSPVLAEVMEHS
jgi:hypothetical protein